MRTTPPPQPGSSEQGACLRFAIGLAALFFVEFHRVWLGWESFFYRDFGLLAYPTVHFWRQTLLAGQWPWWNPYSHCGTPFAAQWGVMAFYPGMLVCLGPLPWSLHVFELVHLWWGGVGMFVLARRWTGSSLGAAVAGVVFAWGGPAQACLEWPNYCAAWGWLPWVVLLVERALRLGGRGVWLAGLVCALQFMAGVPEMEVLTGLACGLLVCWHTWSPRTRDARQKAAPSGRPRRVMVRAGGVLLVMAGLTAVQWLPFIELVSWSQRMGGVRDTRWALPASGLANYLLPLAGHEPSVSGIWYRADQQFLRSLYPGLATWFLAVVGWRKPRPQSLWAGMGVGCLGMGVALALWPTPGPWVRYPVKCALLAHFGLALLAAGGVARSVAQSASVRDAGRIGLAVGLLLAGLGCLLELNTAVPAMVRNAGGRALFFLGFAGVWSWVRGRSRVGAGAWGVCLLCGLLWLDLRFHLPGLHPTLPAADLRAGLYAGADKPHWGEGRILVPRGANRRLNYEQIPSLRDAYLGRRLALWSNANLLEGVPRVGGAITLRSRWAEEVARLAQDIGAPAEELRDFLGVVETNRLDNPTRFGRRATAMPLVTGGQQPVWVRPEESRRRLVEADFDPRRQVLLWEPDRARVPPLLRRSSGRVQVRVAPGGLQSLRCELQASEPGGWVVIAQSWHPGWRARLEGRQLPVFRANHAFQAVPVPAGESVLSLDFRDPPARWGIVLSLLTGVFWLGMWWRSPPESWPDNQATPGSRPADAGLPQ